MMFLDAYHFLFPRMQCFASYLLKLLLLTDTARDTAVLSPHSYRLARAAQEDALSYGKYLQVRVLLASVLCFVVVVSDWGEHCIINKTLASH